jgi:nucleotide sugar dehydrogenase
MDSPTTVVVVGGGKMGLPLACMFADRGANVVVCDKNQIIVDAINCGVDPHDEPEQDVFVRKGHESGHLRASTDTTAAVHEADVVVVLVSAMLTPDRDIDWTNLVAASRDVAKGLRKGALVSYETTLPIGGSRGTLVPVLETSGLKAGTDFQVVFSPERVKSRLVFARFSDTPKVVGGIDDASAKAGVDFYARWLGAPVINVGSLEAAEFVKLGGMIYRDVNIAVANELARVGERLGLDVWSVLEAANTDGETFLLRPGIGVGGHCTPVYPYFLINGAARAGISLELFATGRAINEDQPRRQLERLKDAVGSLGGKRVHILGLGFRPQVREDAYSPAKPLQRLLQEAGATVTLEDPLYDAAAVHCRGYAPGTVSQPTDAVVLNTAHPEFLHPDFAKWRDCGVKAVLDGRALWNPERVTASGITYICVGKPV